MYLTLVSTSGIWNFLKTLSLTVLNLSTISIWIRSWAMFSCPPVDLIASISVIRLQEWPFTLQIHLSIYQCAPAIVFTGVPSNFLTCIYLTHTKKNNNNKLAFINRLLVSLKVCKVSNSTITPVIQCCKGNLYHRQLFLCHSQPCQAMSTRFLKI